MPLVARDEQRLLAADSHSETQAGRLHLPHAFEDASPTALPAKGAFVQPVTETGAKGPAPSWC